MKKRLLFTSFFSFMFIGLFAQSIGIIGDATPTGWDSDTDMIQDMTDPDVWTLDMTLTAGAVKFRQDDDWVINWGSADFPSGFGEQGGADIPVLPGDYSITFNSATGEYYFDVSSDIGIIGTATPDGWDADTDLYKDPADANKFYITMNLVAGDCKFRKDDDWAVNWGGVETPAEFPEGEAIQEGSNIAIPADGEYMITLDTSLKTYSFLQDFSYATVGLIGTATPNGWDSDTTMSLKPGSTEDWRLQIDLVDGEAKFRANDDWLVSWGAVDFPAGTATEGGENIPVTAGEYFVSFNSTSGEYNFKLVEEYATLGIIGDATPDGWDADTDLEKDATNPHMWSVRMDLTDGEAKFRADDDWAANWGSGEFPAGTGEQDGANIPVVAGDYLITFNSITGEYNFQEVFEYGTIGIIGKSGPNGDWETDFPLTKNEDDFNLWTANEATITDYDPDDTDGSGIKFRAENDWTVNWGEVGFPAGTGSQDGSNIECTAGTYGVTFNSLTGEYVFGDPISSTHDIIDPASIKVSPNPTNSFLNIDLDVIELKGQVKLTIVDMAGRIVKSMDKDASNIGTINVSDLQAGNYMLTITNEKYMIGKRFIVSK